MKYYCGECRKECDTIKLDYGIGAYEYWGARETHSNIQTVSSCCEADLFADEELEEPVEFVRD